MELTVLGAYVALSVPSHARTSDGRTDPIGRGPNSATIFDTWRRTRRSVEGRCPDRPFNHVPHHCSTVVLAVFGSTYVPVT
jgi:hypothetical protein